MLKTWIEQNIQVIDQYFPFLLTSFMDFVK